jgi:hypothetical protein
VVEEFCTDLTRYRVTEVTGDRYAGEWPREQFRKRGVKYQTSDLAASELFRELLPLLNTGTISLLDDKRRVGQLCSLERRVGRGGRDVIDHPRNAKVDVANAIAGVAWIAQAASRRGKVNVGHVNVDGSIAWTSNKPAEPVTALNRHRFERADKGRNGKHVAGLI